jgi:hypothetical protein
VRERSRNTIVPLTEDVVAAPIPEGDILLADLGARARPLVAKPFGSGLETVIENSAAFHTDRVCVPILFQENNPVSLLFRLGQELR